MIEERKIVKCKGCGAPIFFEDGIPWYGKRVAVLVETAAISSPANGIEVPAQKYRVSAYVSHFVNCPKVGEFSRGKKRSLGDKPIIIQGPKVLGGYQPDPGGLDPADPPRGGSGVPSEP